MSDGGHIQIPMRVWVDIDRGIASMVKGLNEIPGVRTHASCEGNLDNGPAPYGPYVMVSWSTPEARAAIAARYNIEEIDRDYGTPTNGTWGYAHPSSSTEAPENPDPALGGKTE